MNKLVTLAAAAFFLFTSACKKDDKTTETSNTSIVGLWTLSEVGTDTNNNNIVDAGETTSAASYNGTLNLKSDNTVVTTINLGTPSTQTGTYTYTNNIITTIAGGTTKTGTVTVLTANKLVIKRTVSGSAQWEVYTK